MARDPGPETTFQQGFPWPGLGPRASRGCVRGTTAFSPPPAAAHGNFFSSGRPGERSPRRTTLKPPVHLVSDRRQCSRGRGEGTRGFPSPGSRGPSKEGSGRQSPTLGVGGGGWGEDTGNRREAVGLLRVPCAPRGSAAPPPHLATPPPSRPSPARTHQLLQVLLRELGVAVPLLLELVAGGFRHHHHPRGAEAAVGGAATARQLARLPVPQGPPSVRARAPQSRPASRHAPAAAQQEAPVASHGPRGCGCRLALPAAASTRAGRAVVKCGDVRGTRH